MPLPFLSTSNETACLRKKFIALGSGFVLHHCKRKVLPTCGGRAYQHRVGQNEVVSHFSETACTKIITPYFILLFSACVAVSSCIESKTIPTHPHGQVIQTLELKLELSKGEQR